MATKRQCYENARGRLIAALMQVEEALNYTDLNQSDSLVCVQSAQSFIDDARRMISIGKTAD